MTDSTEQPDMTSFRREIYYSGNGVPAVGRYSRGSIRMNWVRAITAVCALWSTAAWGATLTWDVDSAPDLAGYRIYQCSQLPCTLASGQASALTTLGKVTSFNIGTPAVTQYYFVTAYDLSNNESAGSNLATYIPAGALSTPPPPITPPPPSSPPVTPPPVPPAAIGATPASLSFAAPQGGANPASKTLSISNSGGGTLNWTASDSAPWLRLSRTSGTDNGVIIVSVLTGTTSAGTYNGTITLSAIGIASVTVPVAFTVDTTSVPPPAIETPPQTPSGLHIGAVQ